MGVLWKIVYIADGGGRRGWGGGAGGEGGGGGAAAEEAGNSGGAAHSHLPALRSHYSGDRAKGAATNLADPYPRT